jgi:hypothetical protein
MKKGDIFWGALLLILGSLLLLRNFDLFNFSIRSLLRLWPLIFVLWGIAVLPVKQGIKFILFGITILLGVLILAFTHQRDFRWFGWHDWHDDIDYEYKSNDDEGEGNGRQDYSDMYDSAVTYARLDLNAAAGKFYIKEVTSKLFEFDNEGDSDPYNINTSLEDSTAIIYIKHKNNIRNKDLNNSAWLSLNPGPVWDLNIDVGAADLEMDLSHFKVERVDIDGGASKIALKLGTMTKYTKVTIDAGASGINIEVPYESACEIKTNTVLSSRDIDGFIKISDGLYQTSNFSDAVNQIIIEIDAAVSGVEVKRI